MKSKRLSWISSNDLSLLQSSLQEGYVSIGASDTVIGFLAPLTEKSFFTLNKLKKRDNKPYLIIIGSPRQIPYFTSTDENFHIENIISKFWPGPLTLVMNAKKELPSFMKSKNNTIALRVPDHKGLLTLLKNFKGLFSTSANKSNESIPKTIKEINPEFLKEVAYIINDDAPSKNKLPSTILDVTSLPFKLIREGAISKKELKKVLKENLI